MKIIFEESAHADGVFIENLLFCKYTGICNRYCMYVTRKVTIDDWFAIYIFEAATGRCARECVSDCVKGYRMEEGRHA